MAKRQPDPYTAGVTWYKIKNPAYTQIEGRGDIPLATFRGFMTLNYPGSNEPLDPSYVKFRDGWKEWIIGKKLYSGLRWSPWEEGRGWYEYPLAKWDYIPARSHRPKVWPKPPNRKTRGGR